MPLRAAGCEPARAAAAAAAMRMRGSTRNSSGGWHSGGSVRDSPCPCPGSSPAHFCPLTMPFVTAMRCLRSFLSSLEGLVVVVLCAGRGGGRAAGTVSAGGS